MPIKPALQMRIAPEQRLIMTFALRQALEVLQMPQLELAAWLKDEIERNPLLEIDPKKGPSSKFRFEEDIQIPSAISLQENLMRQVRENFSSVEDRTLAEQLLGHLDEKGFLACEVQNPETERMIRILQTFDPPGICARNLQESLLLQLRSLGKEHSAAFQIIDRYFDDLLHSRFVKIKKNLGTSDLSESIKILSRLYFRPLDQMKEERAPPVLPDIHL